MGVTGLLDLDEVFELSLWGLGLTGEMGRSGLPGLRRSFSAKGSSSSPSMVLSELSLSSSSVTISSGSICSIPEMIRYETLWTAEVRLFHLSPGFSLPLEVCVDVALSRSAFLISLCIIGSPESNDMYRFGAYAMLSRGSSSKSTVLFGVKYSLDEAFRTTSGRLSPPLVELGLSSSTEERRFLGLGFSSPCVSSVESHSPPEPPTPNAVVRPCLIDAIDGFPVVDPDSTLDRELFERDAARLVPAGLGSRKGLLDDHLRPPPSTSSRGISVC